MTITDIQRVPLREPGEGLSRNGGPNPEQAAQNREIAKAIQTLNAGGGVGPKSELRFAIDQATGTALIRIVDRITDEVITQVPRETVLRAAEVLKSLQAGGRIA